MVCCVLASSGRAQCAVFFCPYGCVGAVGSGWVGVTGTVGVVVAGGAGSGFVVGAVSPVVWDAGGTVAGGCLIKKNPITNATIIAPTTQYVVRMPLGRM
jgi:hypothetical protein